MLSPRMFLFPWAGFGVKEEEIRVEDSLHSRISLIFLTSKVFLFERHYTRLALCDFGVCCGINEVFKFLRIFVRSFDTTCDTQDLWILPTGLWVLQFLY